MSTIIKDYASSLYDNLHQVKAVTERIQSITGDLDVRNKSERVLEDGTPAPDGGDISNYSDANDALHAALEQLRSEVTLLEDLLISRAELNEIAAPPIPLALRN